MSFIKAYNKFKIAFGLMIFALGSTIGNGLGNEIGIAYADEIVYDGHSQAGSYELNSSSYFDDDNRHMSVSIDVYNEADSEVPENYNYVVYINDNAVANGTKLVGEENELDLDLSVYGAGEYIVKTDVSTSGGVVLSALEKIEVTPVEDNNLVNEVPSESSSNVNTGDGNGSQYSNAYISDWGINSAYYGDDTPIRKNQKVLEEMAETLDNFEYEYKDGDNVSESTSDSKYIIKDTTAEKEAIERQSKIKYIVIGSVVVVLISLITFIAIKKKKDAERKEEELLRKKIEFANKAKGVDKKAESEDKKAKLESERAESNEEKAESERAEAHVEEERTEVEDKEAEVETEEPNGKNEEDTLADIQAELDNISRLKDDEIADWNSKFKSDDNVNDTEDVSKKMIEVGLTASKFSRLVENGNKLPEEESENEAEPLEETENTEENEEETNKNNLDTEADSLDLSFSETKEDIEDTEVNETKNEADQENPFIYINVNYDIPDIFDV